MNPTTFSRHGSRHSQQGAALFVALMLLVIVSILGVSVAQVTALQERMANNYRLDDVAFQGADGFLRAREVQITQRLGGGRSRDCRPDAAVGGGNMLPTWKASATANASGFEAMQGEFGSGLSSGMASNPATTIGSTEAASWQCLLFRVAAVGVGAADDANAARTIVQSTYVME